MQWRFCRTGRVVPKCRVPLVEKNIMYLQGYKYKITANITINISVGNKHKYFTKEI